MLSTSSDDTRIHDPLLSDQEIEPDFSKVIFVIELDCTLNFQDRHDRENISQAKLVQ